MERFGVISNEKLIEEIWTDGGHYYLRQEWNNGWLSEIGSNYNWVNPNEDKLDDKVFITDAEELEKRRTEALARMPKRVEYSTTVETLPHYSSGSTGFGVEHTFKPEFFPHGTKVKVIIEEVQE